MGKSDELWRTGRQAGFVPVEGHPLVRRYPPSSIRMHSMIEGVLFDLGDTLIRFDTTDINEMVDRACRPGHAELVERGHRPPTYAAYTRAIRRSFLRAVIWSRIRGREVQILKVLGRCHASMGIRLDDAQVMDITVRFIIPVMRERITIYEEAKPVAAKLSEEGLKLGLVSNSLLPAFAIDGFLEDEGLLRYFPVRIYSSEVRYMKPHRRIFQLALGQLGLPADRVLFVGDRMDNDIRGAARVGMKTMLLLGDGPEPRTRARPDHMIRRLSELPVALQRFEE